MTHEIKLASLHYQTRKLKTPETTLKWMLWPTHTFSITCDWSRRKKEKRVSRLADYQRHLPPSRPPSKNKSRSIIWMKLQRRPSKRSLLNWIKTRSPKRSSKMKTFLRFSVLSLPCRRTALDLRPLCLLCRNRSRSSRPSPPKKQ